MAKRAKADPKGEALKKTGQKWLDRIQAAWGREEGWKKDAAAAVKAYTNESSRAEGSHYDYNIFHANVETIVPAIINSPPIPDVRRRFGDADEPARRVSDILERAMLVQVDDSRLQTELEGQALEAFMAGRGVLRMRFHADTMETETSALEEAEDAAEGENEAKDDDADAGEQPAPQAVPEPAGAAIANERITFEAVSHLDYQHGQAKRWEDRPWESYRHVIQCDDVKGFADAALLAPQIAGERDPFGADDLTVQEIWDKDKREVLFVDDKGRVLKVIPDPLGLPDFFPSSRPVQPIEVVGRLMPVVPFSIYRKLADELDIVTKRISVLTAAMQIKGGFVGALGADLKALADAGDNEIIALTGLEALAQAAGLDKAVLWWPIDRFFPVLAELFKNRDLTKQAIYEITGISDIVRGASVASETATAQQIKTQWGSLRIQKMQRLIERAARDLFVMMAVVIPAKFSFASLEEITAISILPRPDDPPEEVQIKQQVMALLRKPVSTYYRVDVESESTIRADLTMKKQEAASWLDASAKYFAAVGPLVSSGELPKEMALEVYAANCRLFNLGKSVEDVIEDMLKKAREEAKNPQPKPPSPEEVKAQTEVQKATLAAQTAQATAQSDQAKSQAEIAKINAGIEAQRVDGQIKIAETNAQMARDRQSHEIAMQQGRLDLTKTLAEIEKIKAGTAATVIGARARQQQGNSNGKGTRP